MRLVSALLVGLIFGIGIAISGMGNPAKVLNFFDVFGSFDPSLALVMAGALAVAIPGYRLAFRRPAPLYEARFDLPDVHVIDRRLILGSLTFGVGWGIAGYCPGGALPVLLTNEITVLYFVLALVAGLLLARGMKSGFMARKPV